jgi:hypothetical protein
MRPSALNAWVLSPLKQLGIALIVASALLTSTVRGASAPYFDNFDSYPDGSLPANFTASAGGGWSVMNPTGSSGRYSNLLQSMQPTRAHSEISLGNVAGRSFSVSTRFTASTFTLAPFMDASAGLIALSNSDPGVFPTDCYTLEYVVASGTALQGTFSPRGGGVSWQGPVFSTLFDAGQGFIMSLHGEYVDGALSLTARLGNGVTAISYHGIAPTPLNGPYFGYWDSVSGTALHAAQVSVAYDDFSVTLGAEPVRFGNISTRAQVGSGDSAAIGGFIVTGTTPKKVLIRGVKPGTLPGALEDPTLELHGPNGGLLTSNDNWKDTQQVEIEQTGLQPSRDLDSAIVTTVAPGAYTAILRGKDNTTGLGLVEAYDVSQDTEAKLGNMSTRGVVGLDDNVMIGGVIVSGRTIAPVLVRALGPSLQSFGLAALADPVLELHDRNGALLASNDNWRSSQDAEIQATGLAPASVYESALIAYLFPTTYTAIVRGKDDTTGVALIEFYQLN